MPWCISCKWNVIPFLWKFYKKGVAFFLVSVILRSIRLALVQSEC